MLTYDQSLEVMREQWENESADLEERIRVSRQVADQADTELRPATLSEVDAPF